MRLNNAIALANEAHRGQLDKADEPYVFHLFRVMMAGKSEPERVVGVLHDIVEDTSVRIEDLYFFGSDVWVAVDHLTKGREESYDQYIRRVGRSPLATAVKLNDLRDNMDLNRLRTITDADMARHDKYKRAVAYLSDFPKYGRSY